MLKENAVKAEITESDIIFVVFAAKLFMSNSSCEHQRELPLKTLLGTLRIFRKWDIKGKTPSYFDATAGDQNQGCPSELTSVPPTARLRLQIERRDRCRWQNLMAPVKRFVQCSILKRQRKALFAK